MIREEWTGRMSGGIQTNFRDRGKEITKEKINTTKAKKIKDTPTTGEKMTESKVKGSTEMKEYLSRKTAKSKSEGMTKMKSKEKMKSERTGKSTVKRRKIGKETANKGNTKDRRKLVINQEEANIMKIAIISADNKNGFKKAKLMKSNIKKVKNMVIIIAKKMFPKRSWITNIIM